MQQVQQQQQQRPTPHARPPSPLALQTIQQINRTRNCDDLALNFVAAALSGRPPVAVHLSGGLLQPDASSGDRKVALSSRGNHLKVRTECVRFFNASYGNHFHTDAGLRMRGVTTVP